MVDYILVIVVIVLDGFRCRWLFVFWILAHCLSNLIGSLYRCVKLQDIEDKAFVNRLPHGVMMEGSVHVITILILADNISKGLQCLRLRCCRESIKILVLMTSLGEQRFRHFIHRILDLILCLALDVCHFP